MLDRQLLEYHSKPTYHYEPRLGWEQVRPAGDGEVRQTVADQFVKSQGKENLIPSLTCPQVKALLQAEVGIEKNVVLAYHAPEARQAMNEALHANLGPGWRQDRSSLPAPKPGEQNAFFSAHCGGRTYSQDLTISSVDQSIVLRTHGKSEHQGASHVVSACYDPATGDILADTVTSDWNWNIRSL